MAFPDPQPGLVIRYAYLWRSEANRGRDEGSKDRPCVVVLAVKHEENRIRVVVAPITHSQPKQGQSAVEIPRQTKERLKLDYQCSWIITNEVNAFTWPGPDIRPVNVHDPSRGIAYGYLAHNLTRQIIGDVRKRIHEGKMKVVGRDDRKLE